MDVPKCHVQDVTTAPFTYTLVQGGTMDGKMCTTLPGVWEPYEQTWESNRSIRMENIGARNAINPWLKIGPIDFFSQQTIANSVTEGLSTDREEALAIFYFYITHRYHKGNGDNGAQGDVSQAINVFGFNTCGNSTLCLSDLLDKVEMRDCIFSHCPGHVVPQVFFDGRYNTLDGDMATFMLLRDNHTLANELDLVRDHDLVKRMHQCGIMSPMNPVKNNEDYAQYYTWEGNTTVQLDGWAWWNMGMVLRPHEAIEWRWGHETPVKYHGDMTGYPPMVPDTICNGLWEYTPDFQNDAQWRAGATVTNISNQDGVLTATDGGTGTIVWPMKVPYQFIGGTLAAEGDGYLFEIGFLDPRDWRKTVYTPVAPLAEFDGKFKGRTANAYEYWLRCTLTGKASLNAVRIRNDIQMAPLAMPSMTVGDNSFTYLEHTDNKTGANAARNLRITHTWVERSKTRPPEAPESPVHPAHGSESDGTDVVFRWNAATDPDGDAITDYHFQLSDRPDMRWPLSANFDKYISRTPDQGKTCYALPRPGLLTPGQTYYWHVKAKDSYGVWGPWSNTWSFTAQGPAYPLNAAIRYNPDTGTGTLTWSANPVGKPPARYRVYGSDEKGFTVHDGPYEVKLGDTRELANPFPANFVAEVTGTSLDVVGVGNSLPNANKAYYRVVAVDSTGKRSGDSDYAEAPRPFIYSAPVTSAPAGGPYRYQVKAIRSLGDLTRRDAAKPKPGARFWKIEPLKFSLTQKPGWMSIDPDTGLITGISDGTSGTVTVSVTLTKEHRLVHDKDNIVWGNEYEQSKTYETVGPGIQQFIVNATKSVDLKVPKGATRLNIQPAMFYCTGVFEIADLTVTPHLAAATPLADAELPAGMTLDWDKTSIVTVNAKRAQVSLAGIWRFIPAAEGTTEPPKLGWAYIKVPGSWQSSRGGRADFLALGGGPRWDLFDGARVARAWYQRQVPIPAEWQSHAISLRFDRVCTDAMVYVNGTECGRIAWPWGSVDITSAVTPGQTADVRVLVAAIADAEQVGTFWQNAFLNVSYAAASLRSRGLTGNVFLESRCSEARVTDVFVRTSTRKKEISLDVELTGVKQAGPVHVVVDMLNEKGEVQKSFAADAVVVAQETQTFTVSWPWADPRLWDVGQPNLYTLRLKVQGAGLDDEYHQKFGFREFWIEGRQFYLNGTVIRLRQPCFYNGPRMQVGDIFSEMGDGNVDTRGDTADSDRNLDDADRHGYLVAQYILNANKYMMASRGRFVWEQNKQRAFERAAVWMRHYRNHPSVVMWIAGFNFFNSAEDADPRHVGRRGWGQSDERWRRLMVAGQEMFDGLKKLDPTRAYYSHSGAYTGDLYTMNCYLDLLPLQEREEWLSAWAQSGEMPISMVEFGTPMDCTFRRGHHGFESNITSEPLLTEFAAIYFGADAYSVEEPKYRQYLHDLFRSGILYGSSENRLDEYANNHKIQQLYRINTWRSWRTAGLPGGLRTWSWMQDALQEINGPTLAWIAGPAGAYTAKDHHFSPDQKIAKQIVLINDTREPQNFTAVWTATVGGKEVDKGQVQGSLAVSEIRFIPFQVIAPAEQAGGKADGQITLTATIGEATHRDTFAFRIFGEDRPGTGEIAIVDPNGMTGKMLVKLGYGTRSWNGAAAPLVVIGRNALKDDVALVARLEPYVRAGGRALICAQDPEWMTRALGWRVCPKVARRVFPVDSPVTRGIDADDLYDWTGSSTLIEAYPEYVGDYLRGNERDQPYAGWHWGNRGGVSSAAIEKPHRSGWRPLLECEFDLGYTPLMELDYGQGRVIVCTLDLEDHVALDPAARRMAAHTIDYALHCPLSPQVSKVVYLGGATGAAWLDKIGVSYQPSAALDTGAGLLLIGPDAALDTTALTAYLEKGGKVFFLPRAQADGWLDTTLKPAPAQFAGSLSAPNWPEARGLSASDLRWRCYLDTPPWVLSAGVEVGADGLMGRKIVGKGVAVFCQVDPDGFHADEKTYFRYTRWRATRTVAQLLANLGAGFVGDSRIFHLLDTWTLNLDGVWQMQVTRKLTPAASEAAAPADPGVSPEAQQLVEQTVPAERWMPAALPQMLPFFKDNDGEAVFRKEIVIPKNQEGKDLTLSLGALRDFDNTCFNGVEVGRTDITTTEWRLAPRNYVVPGRLVKAGKNIIAVRLYNRFGPGGFAGQPGFAVAPNGDRSGPQATGPRVGLEMSLSPKPDGLPSPYYPDYRTDFPMGDNPYRYYRW